MRDVEVQLYHGLLDNAGNIPAAETLPMTSNGHADGKVWVYTGTVPCRTTGHHGFAVRVLPAHPHLPHPFEPGLILWG